jgi:diaminopimelate decarboxylase
MTTATSDLRCPPLTMRDGDVMLEDCRLSDLAAEFGTPAYLISEARLRANARAYAEAFSSAWPEGEVLVLPAIKANYTLALRRVLTEEGAGCDVFTEGELEIALRAGTDPAAISLSGSTKHVGLLRRAVAAGVNVTLDSVAELHAVAEVAASLGRIATVRFRVRPDYTTPLVSDVAGRPIADALAAYKPGIAWEDLVPAGRWALASPQLEVAGVMTHMGRHSAELSAWSDLGDALGRIVVGLHEAWDGWTPATIDVGGGLPLPSDPYGQADTPANDELPVRPSHAVYANAICTALRAALAEGGVPTQGIRLEVEPGRSMYGDAGAHLTRVLNVKRQAGTRPRTWVEVDTSIVFLPDTLLERNRWPLCVVDADAAAADELVDVVGRSCTSDVLARDIRLPALEPGALIAFGLTGAYQDAGAANFNALLRPGTVLVSGASAELVKLPDTLEDVLGRDRMPARLAVAGLTGAVGGAA